MTNSMQRKQPSTGYSLAPVVDQLFNNSLRRFFDGNFWDTETVIAKSSVPVNVRETEKCYEVDVIAPGCRKEDFSIRVQDNVLSISLQQPEGKKEASEKAGWVRNEYVLPSFIRSFTLDDTVDVANISAGYTDGILLVRLPKNEKAAPVSHMIEVK